MKCLIWNVRGAGRACLTSTIKTLVINHSVDICVLLEPRINGDGAVQVARKNFNNFHLEKARGFSGGIWFYWNNDISDVEVVLSTKQSVIAIVKFNNQPWVLTAVYGSPKPHIRKHLWTLLDDINKVVEDLNYPWVITGGFNEITNILEKKEGSNFFTKTGFIDFINRNGFMDMGFHGQPYTWISRSSSLNPIRIRLDRGICNTK